MSRQLGRQSVNARELERLSRRLGEAPSNVAFFEAVYRSVARAPESAMEVCDGSPVRVIFVGHDFCPACARLILAHPSAAQLFSRVKELRFVSTRIPRDLAKEFKRLNPRMHVYWISSKEALDREPGSPDPAVLCEDIASMKYSPL